jgi:hypothetical protein
VIALSPLEGIHLFEQPCNIRIANPPKIMGNITQSLNAVRQVKAVGILPNDFIIH